MVDIAWPSYFILLSLSLSLFSLSISLTHTRAHSFSPTLFRMREPREKPSITAEEWPGKYQTGSTKTGIDMIVVTLKTIQLSEGLAPVDCSSFAASLPNAVLQRNLPKPDFLPLINSKLLSNKFKKKKTVSISNLSVSTMKRESNVGHRCERWETLPSCWRSTFKTYVSI